MFEKSIEHVKQGSLILFEGIKPASEFTQDLRVECPHAALSLWHACNQEASSWPARSAVRRDAGPTTMQDMQDIDIITGIERGPDTNGQPSLRATHARIRVPAVSEDS